MSSVTLDIDTSDFDRKWPAFQRVLTNLPQYYISDGVEIVASNMRIEIPKGGSGRLEGGVETQVNGIDGLVRTTSGYGKAVDKGRRGFHIEAKFGGALRFFAGGKIIYRKWSNPGPASANNFSQRTIQSSVAQMSDQVDQRTKGELSKI